MPDAAGRLVEMGTVGAPHGIKGWVRVHTDPASIKSLAGYPTWFLRRPVPGGRDAIEVRVEQARSQGARLLAKLTGTDTRDDAAQIRGCTVLVARAAFRRLDPDRFYWCDLVGMDVRTRGGEHLGAVTDVFRTPPNDVLVVSSGDAEVLVPFLKGVVGEIDGEAGRITVDWERDY